MAGTAGIPWLMEIARTFFIAGSLMGVTTTGRSGENKMQRFYARAVDWAVGDKSNAKMLSEMMAYGLPRLLGMETSTRLGSDSSFFHGAPRDSSDGRASPLGPGRTRWTRRRLAASTWAACSRHWDKLLGGDWRLYRSCRSCRSSSGPDRRPRAARPRAYENKYGRKVWRRRWSLPMPS